jgi:glycolate oxidase iron-sulfur subunit
MESHLADFVRTTTAGREAAEIIGKCVHCGFCNATCPTYQLFGDELDGPRGRLYLIKQVLEGASPSARTRTHLDRCLTCRSCETTCPSGVHFSRLLNIGRRLVEERAPHEGLEGWKRTLLRKLLPRPGAFAAALALARLARPLLPRSLQARVPPRRQAGPLPAAIHSRRMILLDGCVQPAMAPNINGAARRVLDRLGISLIVAERAGCCGAVPMHMEAEAAARDHARRNIDAWWPLLEGGAEAVVSTASACAVQLRDYAHLLRDDPVYAAKAERVTQLARDVSEVVAAEGDRLGRLLAASPPAAAAVAFHAPCTLQHGLKIRGLVEDILRSAGYRLAPVADSHLCCGSAGSYSLLLPEIAGRLRQEKVAALTVPGIAAGDPPTLIASANAGCMAHLQAGTDLPVRHWIELADERLN